MHRNFKTVGSPLVGDRSEDLPAVLRTALRAGARKRGPYV